jgi:hypothetical protein
MELEKRTKMVRATALGLGVLAVAYMCTGPRTPAPIKPVQQIEERIDYSNKEQVMGFWQKVPSDIRYSIVEETVLKMPNEDLYSLGKNVFSTRFKGELEERTDVLLEKLNDYAGKEK